jgi:hypothetical protein
MTTPVVGLHPQVNSHASNGWEQCSWPLVHFGHFENLGVFFFFFFFSLGPSLIYIFYYYYYLFTDLFLL